MTDKLRWNCKERGCFNIRMRPKIEVFNDCFPGRIGFGDVDGLVEYKNSLMFLEWKSGEEIHLPKGQEILIERACKMGHSYLLVAGNAETMEVSEFQIRSPAGDSSKIPGSLEHAKDALRRWVKWVDGVREWQADYSQGEAEIEARKNRRAKG